MPNTPTSQTFPLLADIRQQFETREIADVGAAVRGELARAGVLARVRPGESVAVTAGSRGIDRIAEVTRAVCDAVRAAGGEPFVVPSMGSHGGATAEGQTAVLAALGMTEASLGAPVRSSMDTVVLGTTARGLKVHADRSAAGADHVIVVNRVKCHTKFKAEIESGLCKMLAVGLAKHAGATQAHRHAVRLGMAAIILDAARMCLEKLPVLAGLGLVENGAGRLHTVRALAPEVLMDGEKELLVLAKGLLPKLPFADIDLLIVDRIGKDVSGTGMDTNVTGRNRDILGDFTVTPRVARILVRGLTERTKGNALGIGYADFTTDRLVAAMDYRATVTNALTGISPEKAAIPVHFPTDRQAVAAALDSLGAWTAETVRVVRIRDTLHLARIQASPALLRDLPAHAVQDGDPAPMDFGPDGNLTDIPLQDA
jgi:uncharacterized protein (DUF362 family)